MSIQVTFYCCSCLSNHKFSQFYWSLGRRTTCNKKNRSKKRRRMKPFGLPRREKVVRLEWTKSGIQCPPKTILALWLFINFRTVLDSLLQTRHMKNKCVNTQTYLASFQFQWNVKLFHFNFYIVVYIILSSKPALCRKKRTFKLTNHSPTRCYIRAIEYEIVTTGRPRTQKL